MQNTSEGFDILITVLAMVLLLTVCSWAISSIKASEEVLVEERTALKLEGTKPIPEPVSTTKDGLLSLVVADAYTPAPTKIKFVHGAATFTVDLNDAFFKDQEASVNTAWKVFFKDRINTRIKSTSIDYAADCWVVELED